MGRERFLPPAGLALAAVVVVWAGAFAAIKALLEHGVGAGEIAFLRYAVAAPGFAFLLWRAGGLPGLGAADAARLALAGLSVVPGYHLALNVGERYTTAGTAALVVALAPGMTLGLMLVLGRERASFQRAAGLATAFAGVVVVVLPGSGQEVSFAGAKGPLIVLGAPAAFALYNVVLRPLLDRYALLPLTAATSLVGTVALLPVVRASSVETVRDLPASDAALVLYLGVVCTLFGYVAWNVGLRGLGPTRAVAYAYAIPPVAVVIGALTLDEPVRPWLVLGGALIVAGVALAQQRGGREPRERVPAAPALGRDS